jgi:hypothetical protein
MAISGQAIVTAAGTAVGLGSEVVNGPVAVKALETNTGIVAIGNDGANGVTLQNGLRLEAGEVVVLAFCGCLESVRVNAAVNGEGVSWLNLVV